LKSASRRGLWSTLLVFGALAGLAPELAHARVRYSESWARRHFAAAERAREALNGRPLGERTRHDYQRVLNAYRAVYNGAPTSSKADPSAVAVAETLVEMGRHFGDDKILHEAIDQYKFLRREYPGSRYRSDALFTIGEIYQDDLNDPNAAKAAFQEFLRRYPNNRLSEDARQAILALDRAKSEEEAGEERKSQNRFAGQSKKTKEVRAANPRPEEQSRNAESDENKDGSAPDAQTNPEQAKPLAGRLARIIGIRHWSTPDYTRVAIDVENNVEFSSERIAHPARIYFDLRDTRLASTLVGKTLDVDDGLLKKVRVAQFSPRRTRIVLEVDNLSHYDAFLLPDPPRLIIDIHGNGTRAKRAEENGETADAESEASKKTVATGDGVQSAETDGTASADATEVRKSATTSADSIDTRTASALSSSASKSTQDVVVKRIVDAGDDDSNVAPQPSARKARSLQSPSSKRIASDPDTDSDGQETTSSETGQSDLDTARHQDHSRLLALAKPVVSDVEVREAKPTVRGDRSLIRALGLKIGKIVIDPGHGGHDTGTIGPNGLEEKDLVLDVSRRLGKLLETRLGAEVIFTRKDDTFIPLETRTAIANQARADLFISVHANSSHDPEARGVETYYLNFTSSPDALEVAARENAVSETSIYGLQDLVKKIALKEKIEESREFASDVEQSLHSGLSAKAPAIRDRGVKKAPFIVLIGANMPSILAEISFVSNPIDERRLSTSEYRQRIAESLYRGIANYVNGLSGVKVASKLDKSVANN
jgi:N-acetylmuramoyl-L-alanine amidase